MFKVILDLANYLLLTMLTNCLIRRCVALLKTALKPDIWPNVAVDFKLANYEKILAGPQGVDSNQPNYLNICTCLELLTFLLSILRKDQILAAFKPLQKSIATCMNSQSSKVTYFFV